MQKRYKVEGMTCGGCVATVKQNLEDLPVVKEARVQLNTPQAILELNQEVGTSKLQAAIGKYKISEIEPVRKTEESIAVKAMAIDLPEPSFTTYRPLLMIIGFITGVALLAQYPFDNFSTMLWMRHFMAGFFLVFAFFKLLNLSGFASSYQMYDIIAKKWHGWGYIYPFVELTLGVAYLINFAPVFTNWATVIILGISSIGVIQSNLNKRKIKCACLGDVFNLPMSTVTIVEDVAMVAMAAGMLWVG